VKQCSDSVNDDFKIYSRMNQTQYDYEMVQFQIV